MNLVTVIIPYYKNRNFIKDCLVSVLKQTYKNLEIIIIYDDTNHKDLIYIKTLTHIDSRVKIIVNKKNLGAGNSRNIGIQKSKEVKFDSPDKPKVDVSKVVEVDKVDAAKRKQAEKTAKTRAKAAGKSKTPSKSL